MKSDETIQSDKKIVTSWVMYDWANSSFATIIMAVIFPVFYSKVAGSNLPEGSAAIYWGYTISAAMLIVALLAPVLGAVADKGGLKKRFLFIFTQVGVVFSALLYFTGSGDWLYASLIYIVANIAFAGSEVFYNSLLPHVASRDKIDSVSTKGYAFGYLGGGLLLLADIVLIQTMDDKEFATKLSFVSVAVWWFLFSLPIFLNVSEPKTGDSSAEKPLQDNEKKNLIIEGFKQLVQTFREIRKYRSLFLFLIAFWFYSDGIGSVIKLAMIYGSEIGLGQSSLIQAALLIQFVGLPATLVFGWLAGKYGTKQMIYGGLSLYIVLVLIAFQATTELHLWVMAGLIGLAQGGTQALSRSYFGKMVPKSMSAEFFGFYGMSARFAGIIGPLTFAFISQATGSIRAGIISLLIFFIGGIFLLSRVPD